MHMTKEVRKALFLALLAANVFGLAACGTIHGAGQDIQKAGEEIQEESHEHD